MATKMSAFVYCKLFTSKKARKETFSIIKK